jgi:uncharacterized delta-60 repeat protein
MWPFASKSRRPAASRPPHRREVSYRPRLEALEDRRLLSAGALDTTFGGTGVVATSLSKGSDTAWTSLLQPNGDIVTAGLTVSGSHKTPSFALVAYTPSGSLDTTFGSGGEVITPSTNLSLGIRIAAAEYSSTDTSGNANKIVEVGVVNGTITMARYNPNGTLDTTFGTKGLATVAINQTVGSVAIQPDGKIVVGGAANGPANSSFAVSRFNTDGSLDTTFGINGQVLTSIPGGGSISSLLVQPDGKIVAGGQGYYDTYNTQTLPEFTLARYNSDGSLDSTFGSEGIVHTLWPGTGSGSSTLNGLALESTGQIVAVGMASPSNPGGHAWALARYNSDGSLDSTFGSGGLVTLDIPISYDFHNNAAQSVAVQSNGELVVLGTAYDANINHTFAVVTLTATGALDPAFGGSGWVLGTDNSATSAMSTMNVLVQADGKIVVTGALPDSSKRGASDFALARYDGTTTGL